MTTQSKIAAWALAVGMAVGTGGAAQAQYGPPGPPRDGYQNGPGGPGGWDAPPRGYREMRQRGFRDGIYGAQKDFENRRRWNVNNRDEFRHPNVPGPFRRDYMEGFRRGYDVGVRHFMGGPGRPRPY